MTNTLVTPSEVARDASIILASNIVTTRLSNRRHEQRFARKIGDTLEISQAPVQTARDFIVDSGTISVTDIEETSVDLELENTPYKAHDLTSRELTLELDDFVFVVVRPSVLAIREAIDQYTIAKARAGFEANVVGTNGTNPSTLAHLAAGVQKLNANRAPLNNRVGIVNTTTHASLIQLAQFIDGTYGADRPAGLRDATLGKLLAVEWFMDQNADNARVAGDIDQATAVAGAAQTGTTISVDDAASGSTGTIKKNASFTFTGDTTIYTVTADIDAAGGAFALPIAPTKAVAAADGSALTWLTTNIVYCRDNLAAAIVPPAPLSGDSAVQFTDGVGIRVTMSSNLTNMTDRIVFDTYTGAVVQNASAGIILQG